MVDKILHVIQNMTVIDFDPKRLLNGKIIKK